MELLAVIKDISSVCVVLATIAGGIAVIAKILNYYSEQRLFKSKCEGYDKRITDAHNYATNALEDLQTDLEAKMQEIRAEQEIITMCMGAVLDGLHQLNCNGEVTKASKNLEIFINEKAHKK